MIIFQDQKPHLFTSMSSTKNHQYNMFNEDPDRPSKEKKDEESSMLNQLQISDKDPKEESKLKGLISSRIKKIDKIKSLYEKDKASLNKIKTLYQKELTEEENELNKEIERYLEVLIKRYAQKSFSNIQKDLLNYLIKNNLENLMMKGYSSEKLSELIDKYDEINRSFFDMDDEDMLEPDDEDMDELDDKKLNEDIKKNFILQMLADNGIEADEDFFDGLDLNDLEDMSKLQDRIFEHIENKKEADRKEEKRQRVVTTDKEFTKVYKTLVKKVHPDLTTDIEEKKRREVLMKELSMVWKQRDYYQLLKLQSQIEQDHEKSMDLTKDHLQQIANDLLDKIREVEKDRYIYKKHPENEFYLKNFYSRSDKKIRSRIKEYKQELKKEKNEIAMNILEMKTQKTTKEHLKYVEIELFQDSYFNHQF